VIDAMMVRTGRAVDVLNDAIRETDAALVVLGGKHHSTLGRWLGGSTVQQVVRRLATPLLVTAGELRARPRVLVAVDPSYAAVPTAQHAVAFARLVGGPLHALHVVEPAPALAESIVPSPADAYASWSRERIERDIWTILPLPDESKVIRSGIALETIVQEAAAWRADVIVVGSHGKGWMDRLLIGSVTEDLLNNLPCAVLVIPVPAPDRRETAPARQRAAALG
jgi:nucleotide-binding universal stress UspA family protein